MRPANPAAATRTRLPRSLRTARLQAGLTQAEAARRAGVSERTIRGWEAGDRRPVRWLLNVYIGALTRAQRRES